MGNFYRFRNTWFFSYGFGGYQYKPMKGAQEAIMDRVSRQAYSLRKEDAIDIPEQVYETRYVYMDEVQQKAYEMMKKENILEFKDSITLAANELAKIMKLRQVTSGWTINTKGIPVFISDTKVNALKELLEEIPQYRQVIIWVNFHFEVLRLKEEFKETACVLYGDMPQKEKIKSIEDFQNNKYRLLIAHPLSGGSGINFQQSSYAVWFSLSYSSEQYIQANDRQHRIGQINKCTYFHLLAKDTIDEVIYKVVNKKADLVDACLDMLKGRDN
jgi:SNF2 family DNA or RNA helicase